MNMLKDYKHFDGRHWETGSVLNALAYQGVVAPHTGQPLSEAMLLGISGGINFGYFIFHYKGYDPQVALLTRNTFAPLQTLLERLGIVQTVLQTASADKGLSNLLGILASGRPAIVWADTFSLPYNALQYDDSNWAMQPLVVFGHDGDLVHIADRSSRPLTVPAETLIQARARVKKEKFRVLSLDPPNFDKLPTAVTNAIWQCVRIFTEAPPKGAAKNFGLSAMQHWAKMLINTRNNQSWARYFPPGSGMYHALVGSDSVPGMYSWIQHWGGADGAERASYAQFLEESANLLVKPALTASADLFRQSHTAWIELAELALPDSISLLSESRQLLDQRNNLFIEKGDSDLAKIETINQRLHELKADAAKNFPVTEVDVVALRETLSSQILKIHAIEKDAIQSLADAMA